MFSISVDLAKCYKQIVDIFVNCLHGDFSFYLPRQIADTIRACEGHKLTELNCIIHTMRNISDNFEYIFERNMAIFWCNCCIDFKPRWRHFGLVSSSGTKVSKHGPYGYNWYSGGVQRRMIWLWESEIEVLQGWSFNGVLAKLLHSLMVLE